MSRFTTLTALILTVHCGGTGGSVGGKCESPITDEEAIALAEDFVRANGYTVHDPDRSKVVRGYMDTEPLDELLALRRGVLRDHAVGYSRRGDEWIVAFTYSQERTIQGKPTGLSVVVDKCGKSLSMPHETVWPYEMETDVEPSKSASRQL